MRAAEVFDAWAPPGDPWSPWAKPVAFTLIDQGIPPLASDDVVLGPVEVAWAPAASASTAIIVDLPGPESVATGLALARRGYRPVPLFNGCHGPSAVIDVAAIVRRLESGVAALGASDIGADAPPAFLLDSRRGRPAPGPGAFDNRWVVLPQDFPSATFLASRGIAGALVVDRGRTSPRDDLVHVLFRWQEAGIAVRWLDAERPGRTAEPITVEKPSKFKAGWYVALVLAGLRRGSAGGFGALVPVPPPPGSGGGFA